MTATAQKQTASFNHLALYVSDLEKSTSFYKNIIQLEIIPEPFKDGAHTWLKIGDRLSLHLVKGVKEKTIQYKNNHVCFSVADMESFTKHLSKSGVHYEDVSGKIDAVGTRVDGVKQIYFQDPDGYWIEINDEKG